MSEVIQLDPAIVRALKSGEKVVEVQQYGTSSWASTARVDVQGADDSSGAYFLKTLKTEDAAERVLGEYRAMLEIHSTSPNFAPQPRAYGKCDNENAYFFLCDYLTINHDLPNAVQLGKKLAELHHKSISPTGKFGFHVTTFDGKLPLNTTWDSNWTSFFKKLMLDVYKLDTEINGFWKPLDDVMQITLEKLIPRLLDPLIADGRSIKPCLIHGDLWESNIGTDAHTGELYIFDACSYYAHHEKEVGIWRCEHHQMKAKEYRNEYFKNYKPSEPVEEFDDRNRLYSVETLIINSAHFPGANTRQLAIDELKYLLEKYVPGDTT
ncbi:Fructosamine/Ketosamine-3-kinase [Annulohypoxylon maeteangense]|uniref:Fructosamine/Ketosamine-3-kinase n=1 Tax=Annulohypoxylon maeteangense TaxID=1927788 RepID=UPI002008C569|nr:Fructosamine/Ketosamine-3-kinase [Annulohypoxylon maeteangense]KAI0888131.1 Fructosamine/Ketosamine-3-kinase [Annulohypoxylon maeteangense]